VIGQNVESRQASFALICARDGTILTVIGDTSLLRIPCVAGATVAAVVGDASAAKAEAFIRTFDWPSENGTSAKIWEMIVPTLTRDMPIYMIGGRLDERRYVIAAAQSPVELALMCRELTTASKYDAGLPAVAARLLEGVGRDAARWRPDLDRFADIYNRLAVMERELAQRNLQMARLDEERNLLLGIVAHDLRNPLNVISGYCELLLEDPNQFEAEPREFMSHIQSASSLMLNLVNDLLDYSRIEAGKLRINCRPTDLRELVASNLKSNELFARHHKVTLIADLPSSLPLASIDPARIEQVLSNLLINAIKFSPPGSAVTVKLSHGGGHAVIAVHDNGPGIPPEELARLFKPFSLTSVKSAGNDKSTGLGLAIARKAVEAHDGLLTVESKPGVGSTFIVSLPLTHKSAD
jgi:signal transduction histidine kinase